MLKVMFKSVLCFSSNKVLLPKMSKVIEGHIRPLLGYVKATRFSPSRPFDPMKN
jgi:hypothetical protein